MSRTGWNISGLLSRVVIVIVIVCWSVSLRWKDRIVHSSAVFSNYVILRMQNDFLSGTILDACAQDTLTLKKFYRWPHTNKCNTVSNFNRKMYETKQKYGICR